MRFAVHVSSTVGKDQGAANLLSRSRGDGQALALDSGPHEAIQSRKLQSPVRFDLPNDGTKGVDVSGQCSWLVGSMSIQRSEESALNCSLGTDPHAFELALHKSNGVVRITCWTRCIEQIHQGLNQIVG